MKETEEWMMRDLKEYRGLAEIDPDWTNDEFKKFAQKKIEYGKKKL